MTKSAIEDSSAPTPFELGRRLLKWLTDLFPIYRSITGAGVRESLRYLTRIIPEMAIKEIPSGTRCFDWEVPEEWSIEDAYILNNQGEKIIDFKSCNLHVVGYSIPVNMEISREELDLHLFSIEDLPDAIPYVTSYYRKTWGFCISHNTRTSLKEDKYRVVIKSSHKTGVLNYGEVVLPGETSEEIFLSTYICHPSMANNELSGPVVQTALTKWLAELPTRRYTYRCIWIPETIGSIAYLSMHLEELKRSVVAGYVITCVGDDRSYSFLPSRNGGTLADRAALHVLNNYTVSHKTFSFLERGSDERQFCFPGVDLPVASVMRTKYGCYPEYHTSLDNLDLVSEAGLLGAYEVYKNIITLLENNYTYMVTTICEPRLGSRSLYPELSRKENGVDIADLLNVITYCDGTNDLIDLCSKVRLPYLECLSILDALRSNGLVARAE